MYIKYKKAKTLYLPGMVRWIEYLDNIDIQPESFMLKWFLFPLLEEKFSPEVR